MVAELEYQMFMLSVIILYMLYRYPKLWQIRIISIICLPLFLVNNWSEINQTFALTLMLMIFVLDFFHLQDSLQKSKK